MSERARVWDERNIDMRTVAGRIDAAMQIVQMDLRIRRLEDVLMDLLNDTQHSEHDCGDVDCPVSRAQAVLEE